MANLLPQPPEAIEAIREAIRRRIAASGKTTYAIERDGGPSRSVIGHAMTRSDPTYGLVRDIERALGLEWFTIEMDARKILRERKAVAK